MSPARLADLRWDQGPGRGWVTDELAGRTLVNLTSSSSDEAQTMEAWAAGIGASYLDGAIMMTPPGIGEPETLILYAGRKSVFEAHEAALRTLAGGTTHLGEDPGMASLYDVALLGIMMGRSTASSTRSPSSAPRTSTLPRSYPSPATG